MVSFYTCAFDLQQLHIVMPGQVLKVDRVMTLFLASSAFTLLANRSSMPQMSHSQTRHQSTSMGGSAPLAEKELLYL